MKLVFRYCRLILAILLIVVSIWALYLPPLFPSSTRALVNAKTYQVNAPVAGTIESISLHKWNQANNNRTLLTIRRDQEKATQELTQRRLELAQQKTQYQALTNTLDKQRGGLLKSLNTRHDLVAENYRESIKELNLIQAEIAIKSDDESKLRELFDEGIITQSEWQQTKLEKINAERELSAARLRVLGLKSELGTINASLSKGAEGISLEDNALLLQEIRSMQLQKVSLKSEIETLEQSIENAIQYLSEGKSYEVNTSKPGVVWKELVVTGQTVAQGDPLLEVATQESLFVEAYLSRHFLDSIQIGDSALIYINDDKKFYSGKVLEIQSQEQQEVKGYAIGSISPGPLTLKVVLELPKNEIQLDALGHLAKVVITNANPSLSERIMIWLSVHLRGNT